MAFYHGIDLLHRKSWKGESLIRNESSIIPWLADYYEAGKPVWLIEHGRSDAVRTQIPAVLALTSFRMQKGLPLLNWILFLVELASRLIWKSFMIWLKTLRWW